MCWSNHRAARGYWSRDIDRRVTASHTDVRVSDAERDAAVEQLSRHTGEGRLTLEEFEERVEEALHAKTRGDLDSTLRGLPRPPARAPSRVPDLVAGVRAAAIVALVVVAAIVAGPWILFFVVPMAMCRLNGRAERRWHEIDESRSDPDELTLV